MSYRIEITAASLEELADKALALGGRLLAVRTPSASAQAPAVETLSPVIATVAPEPETAPEPVRTETAAPSLDYKTEVAPLVLKLVERFPAIIQIGAAVLALTAAKMIVNEPMLDSVFDGPAPPTTAARWGTYLVTVVAVLVLGHWATRRAATRT